MSDAPEIRAMKFPGGGKIIAEVNGLEAANETDPMDALFLGGKDKTMLTCSQTMSTLCLTSFQHNRHQLWDGG